MRRLLTRGGSQASRRYGPFAFLAAGAVALILALGGTEVGVAVSAKAQVVGEVTSVAGSGKLSVKPDGGRKRPLESGDVLHLGDVIDPDKGAEATLQLETPSGAGDMDLVFISPGRGDEHLVTVERTGKRTTTVRIGD